MRHERLNLEFDITLYRHLVSSLGRQTENCDAVEYET